MAELRLLAQLGAGESKNCGRWYATDLALNSITVCVLTNCSWLKFSVCISTMGITVSISHYSEYK